MHVQALTYTGLIFLEQTKIYIMWGYIKYESYSKILSFLNISGIFKTNIMVFQEI